MTFIRIIGLCLLFGVFSLSNESKAQTSSQLSETRLRTILSEEPGNDVARERLTVLLLNTARPGAAAYHASYLSRRAASPVLRRDAARLLAKLEGPTWGWRPILSLTPSSNLNKGSTEDTVFIGDTAFSIDPDSRAKNGVGLTFGASVWKKWRPGEAWYARWNTDVTATIYDNDDMDAQQSLRTSLTFQKPVHRGVLEFGGMLDARFENGKLARRSFGPSVARSWKLSETRSLNARFELHGIHYPSETFRSGHRASLTLGWTEVFSPTLRLSFGLPLEVSRTQRRHLDYDSYGANVRLTKRWGTSPWQTSFGLGFQEDRYAGDFPGSSTPRTDRVTSVSVGQSNRNLSIKGFVPHIRYVYTNSRSNVSLYDYDSHDIQVTFEKRF